MTAVFKRELGSYFHSPIGYIFLAVFYLFSGFYFFIGSLYPNSADVTPVFSNLFPVILFLIPILTMRLFSEERRHRTDQALFTAPVSLTSVVLGKFLSASAVFAAGLSVTLVYGLLLASVATAMDWVIFWGNFLALLLMGMALVSIGMFISALTESQVIAATGGFAVGLLLLLLDVLRSVFQNPVVTALIDAISFYDRYMIFTMGIFDVSAAVFFLTVTAAFIFLTVRVFEKRRWAA